MKPPRETYWSILDLTLCVWLATTTWALIGPSFAPEYSIFFHNNRWSESVWVTVSVALGFVVAAAFAAVILAIGRFLFRNRNVTLALLPYHWIHAPQPSRVLP